jgi:HD-like signal output (HDOD) protein
LIFSCAKSDRLLVAKKLAEYNGDINSERHFIAALLHDVGRLVMCMKIPHRNWENLVRSQSENKALHLVEMAELGFDHAQVGGALLREWNLPLVYQEVAEFHHNPLETPQFQYETSLCHLSDVVVNTLKLGCSGESYIVPELEEEAWALVKLPKELSLTVIKNETEKIFEEIVSVFLNS